MQKSLGTIPLRLLVSLQNVCGFSVDSLVALSLTVNETFTMALVAAHLNAGVILVVVVGVVV